MPSPSDTALRRRLTLGLLISLQVVAHLAVPTALLLLAGDVIGSEIIYMLFATLGICSGQTSLAAISLGMGRSGPIRRVPLIFLAWAISLVLLTAVPAHHNPRLFVTIISLFFTQLLLLLPPLAIIRRFVWFSLRDTIGSHEVARPNQFSLRYLFFWMAGCACLIGAVRVLLVGSDISRRHFEFTDVFNFLRIAAYPMSACVVFAFLTAWPAVARKFVGLWILVAMILLPVCTYLESLHPYSNVQGIHFFDFELLMWLNAPHAVWLLGNLLLLRLAGYRLERVARG